MAIEARYLHPVLVKVGTKPGVKHTFLFVPSGVEAVGFVYAQLGFVHPLARFDVLPKQAVQYLLVIELVSPIESVL